MLYGAGQIGYALCPQVARGAMLGPDQPIILHLLDIEPAKQSLEGVKMELIDSAFPLLQGKPGGRLLQSCFGANSSAAHEGALEARQFILSRAAERAGLVYPGYVACLPNLHSVAKRVCQQAAYRVILSPL